MTKSKLLKTIPLALGLVGILGCDNSREIKVDELVIKEGPVRVEVVKRIKDAAQEKFGVDDYLINVYDSGGLRVSISKNKMDGDDMFIHKTDSGSYMVTGIDKRFNPDKYR